MAKGKGPRAWKHKEDDSAAAWWTEKELLGNRQVDVGVVILRTTGCSHFHEGGCSMCGYNIESSATVRPEDITTQFDRAVAKIGDAESLKVYTSGSFLDERELPRESRNHILRYCADNSKRLLFESRPEYVTDDVLEQVQSMHSDLEIALGLESANDRILKYSINKGFTVKDYEQAATVLEDQGIDIRTYVLLKPPFLTESEAVADAISTMRFASEKSATVSLNPVNVQRGTLVEKLWRSWSYRPPWLWSVLEVLKSSDTAEAKVVCDPAGGGKERGAHNCGECDDVILDSIRAYTATQDKSRLGAPECGCVETWTTIMDVEDFVAGGPCDLQRFFRPQRA